MSPHRPRSWQRLSFRVTLSFVAVTFLGIGLVGAFVYQTQKQELEATLGTLLLNIARTGALLVDPQLHAEVEATRSQETPAYRRLQDMLRKVQHENALQDPIYTLTDLQMTTQRAHFMVTSGTSGALPGEEYALAPAILEPLGRAFHDGVATHTRIYHNDHGTWLTAFAPIRTAEGRLFAVLDVDYRVDVYLERLAVLWHTVVSASVGGGFAALIAGVLLARHVTGPVRALTRGVERVTAGDLSDTLPVTSRDEVGQLTHAFNDMLDGLRQRDFIRDTFGRYVTPEVAQWLLEAPEGLRLGGEKRDVTILMSDLRGYTRFAEQSEPETVVQILNAYLGCMTEIIREYGGTINEFIGDAIFVIFGAPLPYPDHAERAAACALAMQLAMKDVNRPNVAAGLPPLEMGIGLNSGDAIVGNIGSETRAKFGVVGNTVNLTARVEGNTVGGQILMSPDIYERIHDLVDVGMPMSVQVKGIKEPLLLRELRGIQGRYTLHLPDVAMDDGADLAISLPLQCWIVEEKVIQPECIAGEVLHVAAHRLVARLAQHLALLTNIRFQLHYPDLGRESAALYGKVLAVEDETSGTCLTQIELTAVDDADRRYLDDLLQAQTPHHA